MKRSPLAAAAYGLELSPQAQETLTRCRVSMRAAIQERLQEIAVAAGKIPAGSKDSGPKDPPLRFYVYEGYRVFYQLDAGARQVRVTDVGPVNR